MLVCKFCQIETMPGGFCVRCDDYAGVEARVANYRLFTPPFGGGIKGFEIKAGYNDVRRVSPEQFVAFYRSGLVITDVSVIFEDRPDGKTFAKFLYREVKDEKGNHLRWAFRVLTFSHTPLIEDEGFSDNFTATGSVNYGRLVSYVN